MKFKIGDKIKHKYFGVGEIVYINEEINKSPYAVQFETFNKNLHSLGLGGAPIVKSGHGWWCEEGELELVEEAPHNLIPQIAKMLGVEIGEEFKISNKSDVYKFTEYALMGKDGNSTYYPFSIFFGLISGNEKIIKLPKKLILTEDERVILKNIQKKYKYIARDFSGKLHIFIDKPTKHKWQWFDRTTYISMNMFDNLFQFIKWEDKEAYNIEELLKGE